MGHPLSTILVLATLAWGVFRAGNAGACWLAERLGHGDELHWLRAEFRLDEPALDPIRQIHTTHLPRLQALARQLDQANRDLTVLLDRRGSVTADVEESLRAVDALRAECQARFLDYCHAVSRHLPAPEGRRYLIEMERVALGLSPAWHPVAGTLP
ncbi:MAG: hypothetical protein ACKOET_20650 [Verrucomicrobiota bacterium]